MIALMNINDIPMTGLHGGQNMLNKSFIRVTERHQRPWGQSHEQIKYGKSNMHVPNSLA